MANVELKMRLNIEEDFLSELMKISDHHIDRLLDLDSFPEIKSVSNVILTVCSNERKDNENGEE